MQKYALTEEQGEIAKRAAFDMVMSTRHLIGRTDQIMLMAAAFGMAIGCFARNTQNASAFLIAVQSVATPLAAEGPDGKSEVN